MSFILPPNRKSEAAVYTSLLLHLYSYSGTVIPNFKQSVSPLLLLFLESRRRLRHSPITRTPIIFGLVHSNSGYIGILGNRNFWFLLFIMMYVCVRFSQIMTMVMCDENFDDGTINSKQRRKTCQFFYRLSRRPLVMRAKRSRIVGTITGLGSSGRYRETLQGEPLACLPHPADRRCGCRRGVWGE